eukprot:CAMPEP_0204849852 /NCGR_PEP_ID=MMETSP1347-20130617/6959_1 /ASSEMBLY_ACC=CAM_ASM_000690 /TAXON_ID=215587 /ORGANISM="Aplanochytrium stocchinoi, Strain GSBS06" /LENGTH=77 /DNA_ID=CAMNT_0051992399 /DNA_START=317 /DNA_END=550 /DNA_ORIENTATION=+
MSCSSLPSRSTSSSSPSSDSSSSSSSFFSSSSSSSSNSGISGSSKVTLREISSSSAVPGPKLAPKEARLEALDSSAS